MSVLLGVGVGALLATSNASRYAVDGTQFWLIRSFADATIGWWP